MAEASARRTSTSDIARRRAAVRDTLPALVLLIFTQASLVGFDPDASASTWNLLWSLSPLVPALWLGWAQLRILRRADELERLQQLEAMAIGFGAVMLLLVTGSILDASDLAAPRQWLQLAFIGGVLAWSGALALITSRAR